MKNILQAMLWQKLTLFALFLLTYFGLFNNTFLNALVIQAYCSMG